MISTNSALIAHVVYKLDFGGLENGLVNLINEMPENRFTHVIICLTDYTDFSKKLKKEVQVYSLHKKEGKDVGLYYKLFKLFKKLNPDIVHTRNMATLEALLPAYLAGVPCRIHGEHGRDISDLDGASVKYKVIRKLFRPLVDRFIPLSRDLEIYLLDQINVPKKKITHIYNGVDLKKFNILDCKNNDILPSMFSCAECIVIGTVGRLEVVKDQITLAKAFSMLVNSNIGYKEKLRLVIIGDGSIRKKVETILEQGHCSEISWLPGTRDDASELMSAFDIFVLPSLAEGISNTILEAMASGLPVVATNVGGNGELIINGKTGILVPRDNPEAMAEAIASYIDKLSLRIQHGENARIRVANEFGLDIMVKKYINVYDDIIESKGRSANH